jgi:Arc/MetJ-type ribon-helix-helix transcriptional regulator
MHMTVNFRGYLSEIVDEAIARGIVQTKTEALRAGLLELADKYGLGKKQQDDEEDEREVIAEMDRIERGIRSGKVRTYTQKEFEKRVGLG